MRARRPEVFAYARGLGLRVLGRVEDYDGFDGVMLGAPGGYHVEFTPARRRPAHPCPTVEDLAVFYLERADWSESDDGRGKGPGHEP